MKHICVLPVSPVSLPTGELGGCRGCTAWHLSTPEEESCMRRKWPTKVFKHKLKNKFTCWITLGQWCSCQYQYKYQCQHHHQYSELRRQFHLLDISDAVVDVPVPASTKSFLHCAKAHWPRHHQYTGYSKKVHLYHIRGCSHIMSAKNRSSETPPPPSPRASVSNGQLLADPPSPPRQLSSAFARRPFCTTIFDLDFLT